MNAPIDTVQTEDTFSTDPSGLDSTHATPLVQLADGDRYEMRISAVANRVGNNTLRMLAYNQSIPGPTLRVRQGSEVVVTVRNDGDSEATVHWHGLRLDNQYDGVPYETQDPIPVGGSYTYRLRFPDAGLYWYHPHVREDYGLDMGLYGSIVVDPVDPDYWPPVNREFVVTLDDILVEDGQMSSFRRSGPTHTAMGRFGNVMLTAGQAELDLQAGAGEVVRLQLTNTANTRIFNFGVTGARMKLIGGDSGRYEHEEFVESVLLAPSERAIVDVLLVAPGRYPLVHQTPQQTYRLGIIDVSEVATSPSFADEFEPLRTDLTLSDERRRLAVDWDRPPDKTLKFQSLMPLLYGDGSTPTNEQVTAWTCPMHPQIVRSEPGTCPICGMKLIPMEAGAPDPAHEAHTHAEETGDGLEWEDLMPDINRRTDPTNMIWKLVDTDTGFENGAIDWAFRVGDRVKIRLVNTLESDHPMHHPFHIHGAGRFLVLTRGGAPNPNLVWKDTVLLRSGETVDILLDVTNPGMWMAHCHIAEHNQSGMMFSFLVIQEA